MAPPRIRAGDGAPEDPARKIERNKLMRDLPDTTDFVERSGTSPKGQPLKGVG